MVKKILLALCILSSTASLGFAQSAPELLLEDQLIKGSSSVSKDLTIYLCGGSGNINPQAGNVLNTWSEMGILYSQNFSNAKWLTLETTIAICGGSTGITADNGKFAGTINTVDITGYALLGLIFLDYFKVAFKSNGRLDFLAFYNLQLAKQHSLLFEVELDLYPTGNSFYATYGATTKDGLTVNVNNVVDYLGLKLRYSVDMNKYWRFRSEAIFRFHGAKINNAPADSAASFKESFNIRWNNTVYYSDKKGFGGWIRLRYQPKNLYIGAVKPVAHDVSLHGGITYSFDLSKL